MSSALLLVTALMCGGLPALDFGRRLEGGVGTSRRVVGARGHRLSHAIVVAEVGIAVVLLYAAVLLSSSFARLTSVDTGFSPADVTTLRIAPSEARYRDVDLRRDLYDRLLSAIRGWPDVEAAGAIHFLPIADGGPAIYFRPDPNTDDRRAAGYRVITPGYLETMGIQIVRGRDVGQDDGAGTTRVGLVNQALAGQLWPGDDPIGKVLYRTSGQTFFTVIGLVADVRQAALGVAPQPELYLPLSQSDWASAMTIVVRTDGVVPSLPASLRAVVTEVDPHLPVTRAATMESLLRASVAEPRFYSVLFGLFGSLAFVLAVVGVYGVVAYVVSSRASEIGVRLALGATARDIVAGEIGRTGIVLLGGIGVGLAAAAAGARFMSGLLFGVPPVSVPILGASAAVVATVAALACGVPIRRASQMDPVTTLRCD